MVVSYPKTVQKEIIMELDIEKMTKDFTNEEGQVDYAGLNNEIASINQNEIDKLAKKKDEKAKRKVEKAVNELKNEMANQQKNVEEVSEQDQLLKQLKNEVEEMKAQTERTKKVSNFKKQAKEYGVDDKFVDLFVDADADLDKIDLETLKVSRETITPVKHTETSKTEVVKEKNNFSDIIKNFNIYSNKR